MTFEIEDIKIGHVYLFHLRGAHINKPHYGLVTRKERDYCEVVYCQHEGDPNGDHEEVSQKKAQRALHIPPRSGDSPGPTFFRAGNVVFVAVKNFIEYRGECRDINLWLKLEEYAVAAREAETIDDQRDYSPDDS